MRYHNTFVLVLSIVYCPSIANLYLRCAYHLTFFCLLDCCSCVGIQLLRSTAIFLIQDQYIQDFRLLDCIVLVYVFDVCALCTRRKHISLKKPCAQLSYVRNLWLKFVHSKIPRTCAAFINIQFHHVCSVVTQLWISGSLAQFYSIFKILKKLK